MPVVKKPKLKYEYGGNVEDVLNKNKTKSEKIKDKLSDVFKLNKPMPRPRPVPSPSPPKEGNAKGGLIKGSSKTTQKKKGKK